MSPLMKIRGLDFSSQYYSIFDAAQIGSGAVFVAARLGPALYLIRTVYAVLN